MRTRVTYLESKLTTAIEKMKKNQYQNSFEDMPVFNEVCSCPLSGGKLLYDSTKEQYVYKGFCNPNRLCARIQRDKHRLLIKKSYKEGVTKEYYFDSISNNKLLGEYELLEKRFMKPSQTSII